LVAVGVGRDLVSVALDLGVPEGVGVPKAGGGEATVAYGTEVIDSDIDTREF